MTFRKLFHDFAFRLCSQRPPWPQFSWFCKHTRFRLLIFSPINILSTIPRHVHCNDVNTVAFFFWRWKSSMDRATSDLWCLYRALKWASPVLEFSNVLLLANNDAFGVSCQCKPQMCWWRVHFTPDRFRSTIYTPYKNVLINDSARVLKSTCHVCACPPQVASYFGHCVAVTDINSDG